MSKSHIPMILIGAVSGIGLAFGSLGAVKIHEEGQAKDKAVQIVKEQYDVALREDNLTTDQKTSSILTINKVTGYIDFKGNIVKRCTIFLTPELITCEGGIPASAHAS